MSISLPNNEVLILGINFSPEPTGIGKYTGEFAATLHEQGYQVTVITGYPYYPWWKRQQHSGWPGFSRELLQGISVIRCPLYIPAKPTGFTRMLQDLSFFITSWIAVSLLLIRGRKFNLVYSVMPSFPTAFLGGWVKCFRRKAVWVIHVMDLPVEAALSLGMLRHSGFVRILLLAENWILRKADYVSTISQGMIRLITEKGIDEKQVVYFPNWVDLSVFYPGTPDPFARQLLGLPPDRKIILYSGAIGEKQGLDILPQVAKAMSSQTDLCFVIVGAGPYYNTLYNHCKGQNINNIYFLPILDQSTFIQLLRMAWIHLVLQKETNIESYMPSKLGPILAMGGCALVSASKESSFGNWLCFNQLAHILPSCDEHSLLEALKWLNSNPQLVLDYQKSAYEYALNHLERRKIISLYLSDISGVKSATPSTDPF